MFVCVCWGGKHTVPLCMATPLQTNNIPIAQHLRAIQQLLCKDPAHQPIATHSMVLCWKPACAYHPHHLPLSQQPPCLQPHWVSMVASPMDGVLDDIVLLVHPVEEQARCALQHDNGSRARVPAMQQRYRGRYGVLSVSYGAWM